MPGAKRKLKYSSSQELEFEVSQVTCIRGIWLKEPRPLPIEDVDGQGRFVYVSSKTPWLTEILVGKKSDNSTKDRIANLLLDIRDAAQSSCAQANPIARAPSKRASLELSSDSGSDEADSDCDVNAAVRSRRSRDRQGHIWKTREVELQGYAFRFAYFKRKHYIEASPENLESFLAAARSYTDTEVTKRKAERKNSLHKGNSPDDAKKQTVAWLNCRGTWVIYYTDEDGASKQSATGLKPMTHDPDSKKPLSKKAYQAELHKKHVRAINMWNDLDASEAPRLDIPNCP